jgi:ribosome-associated protein
MTQFKPKKRFGKPAKKALRKGKAGAPRTSKKKKKVKPPRAPVIRPTPAENPRARELAQRIAALVLDKKALDVLILDVRGMTSYADYFVIASGDSERQVSAMAEHVEVTLKNIENGWRPIGTEGHDTGHWVLLDYGEVVAHLFFTEVRAFYDLEGLWADAPRERPQSLPAGATA